jgi:hypothetical protein
MGFGMWNEHDGRLRAQPGEDKPRNRNEAAEKSPSPRHEPEVKEFLSFFIASKALWQIPLLY